MGWGGGRLGGSWGYSQNSLVVAVGKRVLVVLDVGRRDWLMMELSLGTALGSRSAD